MELLELLKILDFPSGTSLQMSRHKYRFIGNEVEFSTSIVDIREDYIVITSVPDTGISLRFEKSKFTEQLLGFSAGDDVRIKSEVVSYKRGYWVGESSIEINLKLISITKLGTTFASRQSEKRQADEKVIYSAANEAGIYGAIKLGLSYGLGGLVLGSIIDFFSRTVGIIIFLLSILIGVFIGYQEEYERMRENVEDQKKEEKIKGP